MAEQLELLQVDEQQLGQFLTQWLAIEQEEDRLRDLKRELREQYVDRLPLRGITTAVKIVRARRTLERHAKEPMPREHLSQLEAKVEAQLDDWEEEAGTIPNMVTLSASDGSVTLTGEDFARGVQTLTRP
jgi:hypothetical protein